MIIVGRESAASPRGRARDLEIARCHALGAERDGLWSLAERQGLPRVRRHIERAHALLELLIRDVVRRRINVNDALGIGNVPWPPVMRTPTGLSGLVRRSWTAPPTMSGEFRTRSWKGFRSESGGRGNRSSRYCSPSAGSLSSLVFHWVDLYWNIMPNYHWESDQAGNLMGPLFGDPANNKVGFHAVDVTLLFAMVGLFIAGIGRVMKGNLMPIKDPKLPEALGFENY